MAPSTVEGVRDVDVLKPGDILKQIDGDNERVRLQLPLSCLVLGSLPLHNFQKSRKCQMIDWPVAVFT